MILLLLALASTKPPVVVSALTTRHLAEDCRGKDTDPTANFCTGYIMGVFDTLSSSYQICPSAADVSTIDAVAVARKYIRKNRKGWSSAPWFVVREAFVTAYPCHTEPDAQPKTAPKPDAKAKPKPRHLKRSR
ncbi:MULTISPECIES: Rap1a/Tai family immunity protein [unclassified Sphingomonas]|uniref:Rap1a/Tai family immunity protein n=1 Tax=unclassified Sphingomonas TaxID=196159 RepID=UPI001F589E65|nr:MULTISPECIES: Rap1a/Tai family immunity protein [unclassified Sphingomonas]